MRYQVSPSENGIVPSGLTLLPPSELAARLPGEAVPVLGRERDEAGGDDVDREDVVVRLLRLPVDPRLDGGAVGGAPIALLNGNRAPVQLEVAVGAEARRDDAVDNE